MELGFETAGNALLICHDKSPVLVTDPWMGEPAYFGSWGLSHEIPEAQRQAVKDSPFVWFSHGHPDHLNPLSLTHVKDKTILLPDHFGGRIKKDLEQMGFKVKVLEDRKWYPISDRIRILCVADYFQDAILLIEIQGHLIANINDTAHHSWVRFLRRVAKGYDRSFLLSLCNYGDVDMIHFFDESGKLIQPGASLKHPIGAKAAFATESFGFKYFIPFSSMHVYQREDSVWTNQYGTGLEDFSKGFVSEKCEILPAYISYDCLKDTYQEIKPKKNVVKIYAAKEFGDSWNENLSAEEFERAKKYFLSVEHLHESLDFISLKVGGKVHTIDFKKKGFKRGITFEVPRNSLMKAVEYEIFDDLLIGNFMKTTLHGDWIGTQLYPHLVPYLTKYADNGRAKTIKEVQSYMHHYRRQSIDWVLHEFEERSKSTIRKIIHPDSSFYQKTKKIYWHIKKMTG